MIPRQVLRRVTRPAVRASAAWTPEAKRKLAQAEAKRQRRAERNRRVSER